MRAQRGPKKINDRDIAKRKAGLIEIEEKAVYLKNSEALKEIRRQNPNER
jgi:hypothetical protein